MAPVDTVLETFEGEGERILWLPSITLGYIFTLTGYWIHFFLAVASIGGARFFIDIIGWVDNLSDETENLQLSKTMINYMRGFPLWKFIILFAFVLLYLLSVIYGAWELYVHFNHEDPILVGLSAIYWGILVIVLLNL